MVHQNIWFSHPRKFDNEDSSTSDSSSDSEAFFQSMQEQKSKPKKLPSVKTQGEISLDELPPIIEDLTITINEGEMMLIGKIHAIVETLVIVHTLNGMKPLDLDSVLFLSLDQPLGRIFDVFGPVSEPFYSIRFNSIDQINERGVKVGSDVFFAPEKSDITTYVFVEELQNQKGSDASWKDNNEPPEEFLDYSDDEKEKRAKDQRRDRAKNKNRQFSNCSDAVAKRPYLESKGNDLTTGVLSTSPSATVPPVITTSLNSRNGPCIYATATSLDLTPPNGPPLGPPADQYVHFGLGLPVGPHHRYLQHPSPPPSWNRFSKQFSQRVGCLPSGGPRDHHSLTGNDHPLLSDLDKPPVITGQLPHQSSLDIYRNNYGTPEFHHTNRRVPSHQSGVRDRFWSP